jgi:P-type E1-E2 ATPase
VYRGKAGCTQTLDISNLLVGDIVILKAGDRVPADCVIIDSSTKVKTKHFSEESETEKGVSDPFLLRDDFIMKGACTALVTCVG